MPTLYLMYPMRPHLLTTLAWLFAATTTAQTDATDIVRKADEHARGTTSQAEMTMTVVRPTWQREMSMKTWSEGNDNALVLITAPAKEKGIVYLKRGKEVWNWIPSVERTIKMPPSMMSQSWMGTDFTNDDLVKESRMSEDFDGTIVGRPETEGEWVVELIPKPTAAVVWGKVVARVSKDLLPTRVEYYDEKGTLARTMLFEEVGDLGGRVVPRSMVLKPADKPDEYTRVRYLELDFDSPIPDGTFTLQALKR